MSNQPEGVRKAMLVNIAERLMEEIMKVGGGG
jgi:hypothetical protein